MKKYIALILILLAALTLTQCSKRSNPVDVVQPQGQYYTINYFSTSIVNDMMDDPPYRHIMVYLPPGYDTTGATRYPVLYLLHGYGGDDTYFKGLYGLKESMDDMINSGQIQPMIVVTPNANNQLGGGFYTNSPEIDGRSYAGKMQDFITNEVVHVVDSVFSTAADRQHRAISGHSMGGYGAVKLAMLRNDLFGSVSSMSGPLAFWGSMPLDTSFHGLFNLVSYVFQEQGDTVGSVDCFNRICPGSGKRLTNMMFAMGSAFSPHDPANPDYQYAHAYHTTIFSGFLDLPFDASGQPVMSIWARWMANDVTTLAMGYGDLGIPSFAGVFDSTAIYFDAGDKDDLGLQYQAQVFDHVLTAAGKQHTFEIYSGGDGWYQADHTMLIGERIKKVVKFHDEVFNR